MGNAEFGDNTGCRGADGAIDWKQLHRRMETAGAALLQPALDPEREATILQARAAALASRPAEPEQGELLECLEFELSGERYAMEMSFITETLPLADFTPVFCTPAFVLGITNVRGRIISIIDLRRFFELPSIGLSDLNRVIVVGNGSMEFGILADAIPGITVVGGNELQPPPATCTGIREEFLSGVTKDRLALLDMAKILCDRRIVVRDEVSS
jgi:purine-binding chemotaxis protein CheW